MDVTPLVRQGQQIIQSYSSGKFKVSGEEFDGAIFVHPDGVSNWNTKRSVSKLTIDDFKNIIEQSQQFDVFLLGVGSKMMFLDRTLKNALKEQGVSVDVMDTGAACRTYNVLMAEGRRVLCALLPT